MFYPIGFIYMASTSSWILEAISSLLYETKAQGFFLYVGPRPMGFYDTRQQVM